MIQPMGAEEGSDAQMRGVRRGTERGKPTTLQQRVPEPLRREAPTGHSQLSRANDGSPAAPAGRLNRERRSADRRGSGEGTLTAWRRFPVALPSYLAPRGLK